MLRYTFSFRSISMWTLLLPLSVFSSSYEPTSQPALSIWHSIYDFLDHQIKPLFFFLSIFLSFQGYSISFGFTVILYIVTEVLLKGVYIFTEVLLKGQGESTNSRPTRSVVHSTLLGFYPF
jgi:hypothetical protein